eukprot:6198769-Pleurochrysis_carterae.AAC.6
MHRASASKNLLQPPSARATVAEARCPAVGEQQPSSDDACGAEGVAPRRATHASSRRAYPI